MHELTSPEAGPRCWIPALSVLILSPLLARLLLSKLTMTVLVGTLSSACGILACSAFPARTGGRAALVRGLTALLPVPLGVWWGEDTLPALYTLAVAVPMTGTQAAAALRTAADRDFLMSDLPGWEAAQQYARHSFSAYPVLMMALAWSVTGLDGPWRRIVLWYAVLSLTVLLGICFLRGITHQAPPYVRPDSERKDDMLRPHASLRPSAAQWILYDKTVRYMEEKKPFLDSRFSLEELSRVMLTNKSYISKVINDCSGMGVPHFVNNYRVRHSMELFRRDPKLKVLEMATMSGFTNGVTFNLAFKMAVGLTPSEWCRNYRGQLAAEAAAKKKTKSRPASSATMEGTPGDLSRMAGAGR